MNAIILDMDGTIADLYSVRGWLPMLEHGNAAPYLKARPLYDAAKLNGILAALQGYGYEVEIVSYLAKHAESNKAFDSATRKAKRAWLKRYLPCIKSNNIHLVKHGSNKWRVSNYKGGTLFDDELDNVNKWNRQTSSGSAVCCDGTVNLLNELEKLLKKVLDTTTE